MRVVATADCHLGFRRFQRTNQAGLNQVEADVARTFHEMVSQWIVREPDVICVAGDLFDRGSPSNPAIVLAVREFTRLTQALPSTIVVVVEGNHDQCRSSIDGSILPLLGALGVHVVMRQAKWLTFPDRDLAILCVPDGATVPLEPDPAYRYNVLVLHGGLEDVTPKAARGNRARLTAEDLHADRWSAIALGDYHVHRAFGSNCCYPGAIAYTSSNIWGEVEEERAAGLAGKGFVEFDLATASSTFHALETARSVIDLPAIDATDLDAAAVNAHLASHVDAARIDGAIVRQVITNCPLALKNELDHKALRSYRARAMQFHLDPRRPVRGAAVAGGRTAVRRLTLSEMITAQVRKNRDARGSEHDAELEALGLHYLNEADAAETSKLAVSEHTMPEQRSEAA